ncbi:MAG: phosphoribosylglycinamide formyltransferase [Myxococcaceae bacterium]
MTARLRVGVLASGTGSNLGALLEAFRAPDFPAEIAVVLSNVKGAGALARAQAANVPTRLMPHGAFKTRDAYDAALRDALRESAVGLVCLAGFMRLVGPTLLDAFPDRVINIHPALLPAFPGLHGPRQALAYGTKVAGCTVHFVDAGTDTGPIIAQAVVPVLPNDDETSLSARILREEHLLYPRVVRWLSEGKVRRFGRRVEVDSAPGSAPTLVNP